MVAPMAGDELSLLRPAHDVVVVPEHPHLRVVGIRARHAKEDAAVILEAPWGQRHQLLGELLGHWDESPGEAVVIG